MHFNEVARHFALVRIARGAYPARAMSLKMWNRLPPEAQAVLEKSIPVWEEAMRTEISGAAATGEAYGRKGGVAFTDFDPAAQAKMDALYTAEASKEAERYDRRFATDEATRVLARAQEIIAARKAGGQACGEAP
jgi:TRAP-type C4-dicarboxylate transport system substrate-binding protein